MSRRINASNCHLVKRRLDVTYLRRILEEVGRLYACEGCGNTGTWNDLPLVLQVDHRDGDATNHVPENLRYLCPNCHTLTPTHSFKGRKHSEEARQKMSEKAKKSRPNQWIAR